MIISRPDYLSRMSFEKQPYKKKCRTYFFASTIYIVHQYIVRTSTAWVNIYCWIYCRAYIFVARGSVLLSIYILSLHTYFFCCVHVFFCCMHIFFVEYIYFVIAYEYECCWILLPKNNHIIYRFCLLIDLDGSLVKSSMFNSPMVNFGGKSFSMAL